MCVVSIFHHISMNYLFGHCYWLLKVKFWINILGMFVWHDEFSSAIYKCFGDSIYLKGYWKFNSDFTSLPTNSIPCNRHYKFSTLLSFPFLSFHSSQRIRTIFAFRVIWITKILTNIKTNIFSTIWNAYNGDTFTMIYVRWYEFLCFVRCTTFLQYFIVSKKN